MTLKRRLAALVPLAIRGAAAVLGQRYQQRFLAQMAPKLIPVVSVPLPGAPRALDLYCLGEASLSRAETLFTKEPETLAWIDDFVEGDVFWDIGANVGLYSLYAALTRRCRVLAFEPAVANCLVLTKNIELNGLDDRVSGLCLALAANTALGMLNLSSTEFGSALHAFGAARDWRGQEFRPAFRQIAIGMSIDEFVDLFSPPLPRHIKVDVDGLEAEIVGGGRRTFADSSVQSDLIELDLARPQCRDSVVDLLGNAGLELAATQPSQPGTGNPFATVSNHIFRRR